MSAPDFADFARPREPCDPDGTTDFAVFADFAHVASNCAVPLCHMRVARSQSGDAKTRQAKQDRKQATCIAHPTAAPPLPFVFALTPTDTSRHDMGSRPDARGDQGHAEQYIRWGCVPGPVHVGHNEGPCVTAPAKECDRLSFIGCMESAVPRAEARPFVEAMISRWCRRTRPLRIGPLQRHGDECVPMTGCVIGKSSIRGQLPSMGLICGPRQAGWAGNVRDRKCNAPRCGAGLGSPSTRNSLGPTGHRPGPFFRLRETPGSRSRCDAGWAGAVVSVAGMVPAKTLPIIAKWRDHGGLMGEKGQCGSLVRDAG